MLHCMSIKSMFPSISNHFFPLFPLINMKAIAKIEQKSNRENVIAICCTMLWACLKRGRDREKKAHFLIYMSQLWNAIFYFCCAAKKKHEKMTYSFLLFFRSMCVCTQNVCRMTLHGKESIYHENCHECGTQWKYISIRKNANKE